MSVLEVAVIVVVVLIWSLVAKVDQSFVSLALMPGTLKRRGRCLLGLDITKKDIGWSLSLTATGVFQGSSTLLLGVGPLEDETGGHEVTVSAGDVIILPSRVSHCSRDFRDDYRYVGVYPKVKNLKIVRICPSLV